MPPTRTRKPASADSLQVEVDKAIFLEVGRIFKRVYRPNGAGKVTLTLGPGSLRIEFTGGGCELQCDSAYTLVTELTAKAFAGIRTAYRNEKAPTGGMTLTFRSNLGEFATPLAGGPAKFLQLPTRAPSQSGPTFSLY